MRSNVLWIGLSLALGVGVGQLFAGAAPAPTAPPPVTRAELASVVRQEMVRERFVAPLVVPRVEVRPEAPPPDEELATHAATIVDGALARGVWSEADKAALTLAFEELPKDTKVALAARLADAVNRGAVRLDVHELPL